MTKVHFAAARLAVFVVVSGAVPLIALAGFWSWLGEHASAGEKASTRGNTRTMALLEGSHSSNTESAYGGGDISIVDGTALAAETSPLSSGGAIFSSGSEISTYVVREGDTLSQIAGMFGVTVNTIRWANGLSTRAAIQPGDKLIILPISGVKHTVKKGDTLKSIAKKYKADAEEILQFNGLDDGSQIAVGVELIIPNGEIMPVVAPKSSAGTGGLARGGGPVYAGYYMRPISGGVRTQGIHGYNGVDLASSYGAPIYASAAGEVIIARGDGGWNGGYGNYVVVKHDNGTQTLYAHLSSVGVSAGTSVTQGQTIGGMGATGRSTGTHLHFEIRGAANPF